MSRFLPAEVCSDEILPGYTKEDLSKHVIEYFVGSYSEGFYKIIELYLEARPLIKQDISNSLKEKGQDVTVITMVKAFLGVTIFGGVSLKAQRFCVANMDLSNKAYLKAARLEWKVFWDNLTLEKQEALKAKAQTNFNTIEGFLQRQQNKTEVERSIEVAEYFYKISTMDYFEHKDVILTESITPESIHFLSWELRALQYHRWLKEYKATRDTKE